FELWDYLGVKEFTKRMENDGKKVPEWVKEIDSFYKKDKTKRHFYFYPEKNYREEIKSKYEVYISDLKEEKKILRENNEATLYDMGEDVLLLEFHTKANAIGPGIVEMVFNSIDFLENSNYAGMVIGNQGEHFSAGANLYLILMAIQEEEWDEIDLMVRKFQEMNMRIKYSNKPIVTAPFGRVLGGGCEIVLHSPYVQASSELYMGLVEIAVGLLPAGGGTKEMLLRHKEIIPEGINVDFYPYLRRILEIIGMAKVSSSAFEAKKFLFLRDKDGITINQDHLLYDAKRKVIELNELGFQKNRKKKIKVEGRDGYFYLEMLIYNLLEAKQITEHEALIAKKISEILTVKDVPVGTEVTEETLLDLERENFLFLCGTQKTRERIEHMLLKGKPLRN
ncbi:MAG: enoyl-CoA hydratase/isomerase family protein, partial [candidate division WOR-3 bacterium]